MKRFTTTSPAKIWRSVVTFFTLTRVFITSSSICMKKILKQLHSQIQKHDLFHVKLVSAPVKPHRNSTLDQEWNQCQLLSSSASSIQKFCIPNLIKFSFLFLYFLFLSLVQFSIMFCFICLRPNANHTGFLSTCFVWRMIRHKRQKNANSAWP